MKKIFGIGLALMMCFAFVVPAMAEDNINTESPQKTITIEEKLYNTADVYLEGDFEKEKYIYIDVAKHINITILPDIIVNSDGEAETFGTQLNTQNTFEDVERPGTPDKLVMKPDPRNPGSLLPTGEVIEGDPAVPNLRTANIVGSANANSGVVGVNQSPGNLNNQANLAAMAVIAAGAQLIEATGFAVQASLFNDLISSGAENKDLIDTSVNDNSGIVGVNQSAGNMNNQFNSAAMAAGLDPVTTGALGEATLKQVSADNALVHLAVVKLDQITGSISGNSGVVSVNQASGDMVNQANVCAIAAKLE